MEDNQIPFSAYVCGHDIEGTLTHDNGVPVEVTWPDGVVTPLMSTWRAAGSDYSLNPYWHVWQAIKDIVRAQLQDDLDAAADAWEQVAVPHQGYIRAGTPQ
jgi:hypothetical protein